MEILFWSISTVIVYAYFGYPIVLFLLSSVISPTKKNETVTTKNIFYVDLIIAAYNEERVISSKIANSLLLDYPMDHLNIWIVSDGSSDNTNSIVREYTAVKSNVHLLEYERTGKSGVLNKAMESVSGEIIVFSDANTEYSTDAIKMLVSHFKDKSVGCVSGRLYYRNPGQSISGKGESFYWKYETTLKKMESKIGYVAGANGAIYAIRKNLFEPFPERTINDDFTASMKIVMKGFKSIYEENAKAFEDVAPTMKSEFNRHVRDGAGHYLAMVHLAGLLNPFLGKRSFIYWSHRIFRWIVPFLLIFVFIINSFLLAKTFFLLLFTFQCIFYLLAFIGWLSIKYTTLPFFIYAPFYFCNLNLALLIGCYKIVTNMQKSTWERTERNTTE